MKNFYLRIAFLFTFMTFTSGNAQLVAGNDTAPMANLIGNSWIYNPDGSIFSVLANDTFNGNAIGLQTATISILTGADPAFSLNAVNGQIWVNASLAPGNYTFTYQVCMNQGGACQTATVTFSTCSQPAPSSTLIPQTCSSPPLAMLTGLPSGDWTLLVDEYPFFLNDNVTTIEGSGESFSVPLSPEVYQYRIKVLTDSGCLSPYAEISLPYMQLLESQTTGVYFDANGDGTVNLGDQIICDIAFTNMSECDITNVMGNGGTIAFNPVDVPAGQTVVVTGIYWITEQDIMNGYAANWEPITGESPLGSVYAKAFFETTLPITTGFHFFAFADLNGNDQKDTDEPLVPYGSFVYEQNNGSPVEVYAYSGEFNLYETNPSNTYNVSFVPATLCGNGFSSTQTYSNLVIDPSGIVEVAFPLDPSDCVDVGVWVYGNNPVPGFQSYSAVVVRNESLVSQSVTVTYTADAAVSVDHVDGGITTNISGNTVTATLELDPLETQYFYVYYNTPGMPAVSLGDQLSFSAQLSAVSGDTVASNDSSVCIKTVVGSYDPNAKTESHGPQILHSGFGPDDTLNYTLHFENTGTANAIGILITDVLDDQLDETTVRLVGSTHDVQLYRSGSDLEFVFDNIQLPPSEQNTQIGKGSVMFTVKPKSGYAVGDVIPNFASIYFDTNPAIVTETVTTEFVAEMSVADNHVSSVSIFPNPALNQLNLVATQIETVEIIDVTGKTAMHERINSNRAALNVSALATGTYFVRVHTVDSVKTLRFVKQ